MLFRIFETKHTCHDVGDRPHKWFTHEDLVRIKCLWKKWTMWASWFNQINTSICNHWICGVKVKVIPNIVRILKQIDIYERFLAKVIQIPVDFSEALVSMWCHDPWASPGVRGTRPHFRKNPWKWPWKSATQNKIFEIDRDNPGFLRKRPPSTSWRRPCDGHRPWT
jgi:hypothetical protein